MSILDPDLAAAANSDLEPPRRIRVAAVLDTWIVSGPGRQLAALIKVLRPMGVDLQLFMFQREGRPPSPFIAYLRAMSLEPVVIPDRGRFDLGAVRGLGEALQAFGPDIVQSHGYRPTGLVRLLRLRRPSWHWIGFFHGATTQDLKDRLYHWLDLRLLRGAERLVVLSEEHKGWFADMGAKVRRIHNAALTLPPPAEPLDFTPLRRPGQKLIGVVSRLSREKGVGVLIEALGRLRQRGEDAALAIAGDGAEEAALRRQAARLGLGEHVHFLGRVGDVMALYRAIDVLAIPSHEGAEGLPNVLLEALSADVPVVSTRVAAVPEVLTSECAGLMVNPGDVEGLVAALSRLLSQGRTREASEARRETIRRFSLEARAQALRELYFEVLEA